MGGPAPGGGAILFTRAEAGSAEGNLWMVETAFGQDGPTVVPEEVYVSKLNPVRWYGRGHPAPRRFLSLWRRDPKSCFRSVGGITSPFRISAAGALIATPFCEETPMAAKDGVVYGAHAISISTMPSSRPQPGRAPFPLGLRVLVPNTPRCNIPSMAPASPASGPTSAAHSRLPRPRPRDRGNSEFVATVWS